MKGKFFPPGVGKNVMSNTYRSRKAATKGKKNASNEFKETTNGEAKIFQRKQETQL